MSDPQLQFDDTATDGRDPSAQPGKEADPEMHSEEVSSEDLKTIAGGGLKRTSSRSSLA